MMESDAAKVEVLCAGKFVELVRQGRWEFARRARGRRAVGIVALTDSGELVLVQQYRVPVGTEAIELPAGLVGDEDAEEEIEAAARRELLEETGFRAEKVEYLFDGPSSAGLTDEQVDLVLATGLVKEQEGGGVEGEKIAVHVVSVEKVGAFLEAARGRGVLVDFKVRLAEYLVRLRQQR